MQQQQQQQQQKLNKERKNGAVNSHYFLWIDMRHILMFIHSFIQEPGYEYLKIIEFPERNVFMKW